MRMVQMKCAGAVLWVYMIAVALTGGPVSGATSNGNDFALYYSEAKTEKGRSELLADAKGRPHYFRYLQIMSMDESENSPPRVTITAFEPSSYMDVRFVVTKRVSLKRLKEEPASKVGQAIAVTGVVQGVVTNTIILRPVIVRHKDRLAPKRGKEMIYEFNPSATFYSYTGGKRAVSLTYKDRDLLQFKNEILSKHGKNGWAEFLERELAKREKERAESSSGENRKP